VGLALGAAAAACGELETGRYQPPPIATIGVVLALPRAPAEAGEVSVLLVWQPASSTTEAADALPAPAGPAGGGLGGCERPAPSCGSPGIARCTVWQGLADRVARIAPSAFRSAEQGGDWRYLADVVIPIYGPPPAEALRDFGSGKLALGYLLFLESGQTSEAPVSVASSAANGPDPSWSGLRNSYVIAYWDGPDPEGCGEACCDLPVSSPGVLSQLAPGFQLLIELEEELADGRLLPVHVSTAPLAARIRVDGPPAGDGPWCGAVSVTETWDVHPSPGESWERCSTTMAGLACERVLGACSVDVVRYERCTAAPVSTCHPFHDSETDSAVLPHRTFHRLPSGDVLGLSSPDPDVPFVQASFYDVGDRVWRRAIGPGFPRWDAAVAELPGGRVLVSGGAGDDDASRSAELFDPATGAWTPVLSMRAPRSGHTATALRSGRVLVVGGRDAAAPAGAWSAELFDPVEGSWTTFDLVMSGPPLAGHAALLLPGEDSPVLLTGPGGGPDTFLCVTEAKEGGNGCRQVGRMGVAHLDGTFTLLPSGKVVALGGRADPASAEVFDPATGQWSPTARMPKGRTRHAAALLPSGLVLVAGGDDLQGTEGSFVATADVYDPAADCWTATAPLQIARGDFALFPDGDGALAVGGAVWQVYAPPVERLCITAAPGACAHARTASRSHGQAEASWPEYDLVDPIPEE